MIKENDIILFQGDSITDAGRTIESFGHNSPDGLGHGYASKVASSLLAQHPSYNLQFFNRGISGHKVPQLYARWAPDTLRLNPAILSILIGINDVWHGLDSDEGTSTKRFEDMYRILLEDTKAHLPNVKLVICQPFITPCGVVTDAWTEPVKEKQAVCKKIADEFDAVWVPFQELFDDLLNLGTAEYWAGDGVHPSVAGHHKMADFWLKCIEPN